MFFNRSGTGSETDSAGKEFQLRIRPEIEKYFIFQGGGDKIRDYNTTIMLEFVDSYIFVQENNYKSIITDRIRIRKKYRARIRIRRA